MRRSYTSTEPGGRNDRPQHRDVGFDLDGTEFKAVAELAPLDLAEFARLARDGIDSESVQGAAIIADILGAVLGEATYQQFRAHCRRHQTPPEKIVAIIGDLIGDLGERPTGRPSDSSDGPPSGQVTAKVVSFSRGTVEQVDPAMVETPQEVVSYG